MNRQAAPGLWVTFTAFTCWPRSPNSGFPVFVWWGKVDSLALGTSGMSWQMVCSVAFLVERPETGWPVSLSQKLAQGCDFSELDRWYG